MTSKSKKGVHREAVKSSISACSANSFFNFSKKLVCITYPGKVQNVNKMFDTLGGIEAIEHVVARPKRNIELRFRPEDLYSKPCISERSTKPNILLKIKIRSPVAATASRALETNYKPEIISYEVVGLSTVTFSFNKLCDFQYLPLSTNSNLETPDSMSTLQYMHDIILPKNLPDIKWFEEERSENLPLFLPPPYFSKSDTTAGNLHFDRSTFYEGRFRVDHAKRLRNQEIKRKVNAQSKQYSSKMSSIVICHIDDEIPLGPNQTILNNLQSRINAVNGLTDALDKIKKFFADRPIASKSCVHYHLQFNNEHYKILLPGVAFYYSNGPWRMMWVRYGFDPRKEGSARMYQSLDFRIRSVVGLKRFIKTKRTFTRSTDSTATGTYQTEPQPSTSAQSLLQAINESALQNSQANKSVISEDTYMLRPGIIPAARQMMYQYCDVHLPDIQAMLSRLPSILPGARCDAKNGWLPPGFNDQCREIVTRYIESEINRVMEKQCTKQSAAAETSAETATNPGVGNKSEVGDKKEEVYLHEILSDESTSSEDSSDDDERGNDVGVDADLLDEIDILIGDKES